MTDFGILIVSHSSKIAAGCAQLIQEVAKDVPLSYIGGTEDGGIGTSFDRIQAALEDNPAPKLLAFYDLGSARMNLEMVSEFSEKDIEILNVPIIEGAYSAAALLQAGVDEEQVLQQLKSMIITK